MTEKSGVNLESRREALYSLMLNAEREEALELLLEHAGAHGFQSAVNVLLEPVLERIGEAWRRCRVRRGSAAGYQRPGGAWQCGG